MFRRFGTSNFTKKADGWKSKHDAVELKDASHGAACLDAFWCLDGGLFFVCGYEYLIPRDDETLNA